MAGRMVVVDLDGGQREIRWEGKKLPDYKTLGAHVDGWIERVQVRFEGKVRDAYVNEEGIMRAFRPNIPATRMLHERYSGTLLHGRMVIWVPDPKPKKDKV